MYLLRLSSCLWSWMPGGPAHKVTASRLHTHTHAGARAHTHTVCHSYDSLLNHHAIISCPVELKATATMKPVTMATQERRELS